MIKMLVLGVFYMASNLSCSSTHHDQSVQSKLNYGFARSILANFRDQRQLEEVLGKPSLKRTTPSDRTEWVYEDSNTGVQRLSVTFDENRNIKNVLWIPKESDLESTLTGFAQRHPDIKLAAVSVRPVALPHDLKTETLLSDDKGVSVLHDDSSKKIEAISWFREEDSRGPAATVIPDASGSVEF